MQTQGIVTTRRLLLCGAIGGLLFILVFLIEGATRADYNLLRQPVSSLSIGDLGWIQSTNFIVTGLLMLACALGLRRILRPSGSVWGPILIAVFGIGLIGAGIFTCDPLNGYPPGMPLVPTERSIHGRLHDLFGLPVFLGLPITCFVFSRWFAKQGKRGWASYSELSGKLCLCSSFLPALVFVSNLVLQMSLGYFNVCRSSRGGCGLRCSRFIS